MKLKYLLLFLALKNSCLKSYPIQDSIWKSDSEFNYESIIRIVGLSDYKHDNDKEALDILINCIDMLDQTKQKYLVIIKSIDTSDKPTEHKNILENLSDFIEYFTCTEKVNTYTYDVSCENLKGFYNQINKESLKRISPLRLEHVFAERDEILSELEANLSSEDFGNKSTCQIILSKINNGYELLAKNLRLKIDNYYAGMTFSNIIINTKTILDNINLFNFTYKILRVLREKRNILIYCNNNIATKINTLFERLQFVQLSYYKSQEMHELPDYYTTKPIAIEKPLEIDIIRKHNQLFLDLTNI